MGFLLRKLHKGKKSKLKKKKENKKKGEDL
jgi:hypothetical protein